ncbi:LOW QUALITY PROTEIN: FMRFamide receptor [Plakobranchus ocellatus]|uniref:FMRFamide receptor n=1 Tax=Plakobranchus ocellatus TaxID=259542 RepID=A0AAV4CQ74_9GAST|nr:LOW QUALITY PROTEIN: FMRFamide receptor [Plakobranchus ocellatus]
MDAMDLGFDCYSNISNHTNPYKKSFKCSFLLINMTTCSTLQSPDEIDTIRSICRAKNIVIDVGVWCIVVPGLVGNGLVIFTIKSMPKSTSTFFVGLLAVSDGLALCMEIIYRVLEIQGLSLDWETYIGLYGVVLEYFPSYSNWLLVLICLERFLSIRFPLQKRSLLTMRRAKLSALVLALVLLLAYGVVYKTIDYLKFDVIDMINILYAVLPLSLLTILIALISCHLRHVQRSRKKIMQGHSSPRSLLVTTPSTTLVPASRQNSVANLTSGTPASYMVVPPQRSPTTLEDIAPLESLTDTLVPESWQNSVANLALRTSASHMVGPPQKSPTTLQDIALLENSLAATLVPASRQNSVANLASGTPAIHMVIPPQKSLAATLVPESRQNSVANLAHGTSASHRVVLPQRNPTTLQDIARLENSITAMMLMAIVCFFLLTMPFCAVLYAVKYSWRMQAEGPVGDAYRNLLFEISVFLAILNESINFILYFLSIKKFRLQLCRILKRKLRSIRG